MSHDFGKNSMNGCSDTNAAPRSYRRSETMLDEALSLIPLGSQTFSKSLTQYPRGVSPFFVERAEGGYCWDVDGNRYIDFVNALASITLGHCDPDVTAAVSEQLSKGTIFSLSHPLEIEVARLLVEIIPCAQKVRFGKNGSDATSGAIRAARAFTGRDRIAMCGYHGWQDWSIGSTSRHKGIPNAVRELTHVFIYNDLASLRQLLETHPGEFAAVILEPMNVEDPAPGFLQGVVGLAHSHGAVAIFDETITGFRFALGGAQELFGVMPDLACFGKGIANGYPLSAVVGRADIMKEFENVFFSFTMGGEALSLAAARAVITKLRDDSVLEALAAKGKRLIASTAKLIIKHQCSEFLSVTGHPSWSFLIVKDTPTARSWEIKALLLQEIFVRGILSIGTHNLTHAHTDADIDALVAVYDQVFPILAASIADNRVMQYLRCKPPEPLFRVR
jgi:glutamate-1-semialdehyde 2,1-aminomutase